MTCKKYKQLTQIKTFIVRIKIKHQAKQAKLSNQIYQNKSKTHMHQQNRSSRIIKFSLFELFACWVNLHVLFVICWLFSKLKFLKNSFSTFRVSVRILRSGLEVMKFNSCSTQLSMKFIMLINVKMPTNVGILTFISMINTTSERLLHLSVFKVLWAVKISCSVELNIKKVLEPGGQARSFISSQHYQVKS